MSDFVYKPGSASLFKNQRKADNEKAPDYTGAGTALDGSPFEMSAWIKEGKKSKYLSISIKPPFVPNAQARAAPKAKDEFEDDVPW